MTKAQSLAKLFRNHPLADAFIVEALTRYADDVLADDSDWGNSFISKQAWQDLAKSMKENL